MPPRFCGSAVTGLLVQPCSRRLRSARLSGRTRTQQLVIIIAILLAAALLYPPAYILWLTWSGAAGSPPDGLLTLNTKDSTRFAEDDPAATSVAISRAL